MLKRFSRFTAWTVVIIVSSSSPLLSGCAASRPQIVIHESPRGSVSLEKAEGTFQAAHPIVLESALIRKVLQGVYVQEGETVVGSVFASSPKALRVFSDEDVLFLSPLLATALSQASQNQVVSFRLRYAGGLVPAGGGAAVGSSEPASSSKIETTSGTVYAYGMSLNLTLTEYRHRPERPDAINMPNRRLPDPTGLGERKVVFLPGAARRPDNYSPRPAGDQELTTLVIDYQLLAKLPASALEAPQPNPKSQEASSEELQSIKDRLIKKDLEMETMKEELKSIRKQLDDQEAQKPAAPRNEPPR